MTVPRVGVRRRPPLLAVTTLGVSLLSAPAFGDASLEYGVKAAFLLNFIKFVEWPQRAFAAADTPIALCVLRQNPFGNALEQTVAGESVGGRRVIVRQIGTPDLANRCHVLFVPQSVLREEGDAAVPVEQGLLTVGESDRFMERGGVISFFTEEGRIRFVISQQAAERNQLRLSARLLRVARLWQPPGGSAP
jgi:hypothetical protein